MRKFSSSVFTSFQYRIMRTAINLKMFFLLLVAGCAKEPTSRTDLLTKGKWQITSYTEVCYCGGGGYGTSTRDIYASYASCEKDNYYIFKQGGIAEVNEGATKCNPGTGQSYSEGWAFNSDESIFLFRGKSWSIFQLNKSTFIISTVVLFGTGETITFTKI